MKEALLEYIRHNELSPFSTNKTYLKQADSAYKTRDAKAVHTKTLARLSRHFVFSETSNLWSFFGFTSDFLVIRTRQDFFKGLEARDVSFLKELQAPRGVWKPRYDIIAVTEDETTFVQLQKLGCTVQLLVSENDVLDLERYDIVQVVDCDDFRLLLERLPQSVFVQSIDDVYLERYLELLSGWRENIVLLRRSRPSSAITEITEKLASLLSLMERGTGEILSEEKVEALLEDINEKISLKIKELTISGDSLMKMLAEGKMPPGIVEIVQSAVAESGVSEHIFNLQIPVSIDYSELESQVKRQSANEFTNLAEEIKRHSESLKEVPSLLARLEELILLEDFCGGVSLTISEEMSYPTHSENLHIEDSQNLFLEQAQPISFQLDQFSRCSILTGANSGGKTTLLEHVIQINTLFGIGLPISGECHVPLFTDVYYFAKNKGSASKGAFETLLTQMAKIQPGEATLILADEIEAVTEPGIAGKIIAATADFFIKQGCFLIIATHLGHEIRKELPEKARIDGIEAKGLTEDFELIVNHNPVMGRLAHSTPELIVERMAKTYDAAYFQHVRRAVRGD